MGRRSARLHENAQIAQARPELAAMLNGEARCLRTIMHAIIKEMSARIA